MIFELKISNVHFNFVMTKVIWKIRAFPNL